MALELLHRPEAETDHIEIWVSIALDNPRAPDAVLDELFDAERLLVDFPFLGRARDDLAPGLRQWPVRDYLIFYQADERELSIVRVLHGARDIPALFAL